MLQRQPQPARDAVLVRSITITLATIAVAIWLLPGYLLAVALGLLAASAVQMLPRSETFVAWAVVTSAVIGSYATVRLGTAPSRIATMLLLACVLAVALAESLRRWRGEILGYLAAHAVGILVAAITLRALPLLHSRASFQTGRLGFVQIGEFTRPLVVAVVAANLVLAYPTDPAAHRWLGRRPVTVLALGYLLELVVAGDFGPAVVTLAGLLASGYAWPTVRRSRVAVLAVGSLVALVLLGFAVPVVHGRLLDLLEPARNDQIRAGLSATGWAGFVGDGSNPFMRLVSASASDLLPAMTIGLVGALPYAGVLFALLLAAARLLRLSDRASGAARPVTCALAMTLTTLIVWTSVANVALAPLTGLSAPFVTMTGSSIIPSVLILAAIGGLTTSPGVMLTRTSPVRQVAGLVAVPVTVLVVIGTLLCAVPPVRLTDGDLTSFPRGAIRTADGVTVARTAADGSRALASPIFAEVGSMAQSPSTGISAYGVETMQVRALTCGARSSSISVEALNRPSRCHPADVVLTMSAAVQRALAAVLGGRRGEAAVLDSRTGAVLGLYASTDTAPGVPMTQGGVESAARNGGNMPGSVTKLVTGAAALIARVDPSPAPSTVLRFDTGTELLNENGFSCPASSVTAMIAYSCNTVAGWLADRVGAQTLQRTAEDYFGFDRSPRYDGIADAYDGGRFSPPTTGLRGAAVSDAVLAGTGIGLQGVRANVLDVAQVGEVIARQGSLAPAPHIVAGTCYGGTFHPAGVQGSVGTTPLPKSVAATIYQGMRDAVLTGTATGLARYGPDIAAKTGTADITQPSGVITTDESIVVIYGHYIIALIVHLPYEGSSTIAVDLAGDLVSSLRSPGETVCR